MVSKPLIATPKLSLAPMPISSLPSAMPKPDTSVRWRPSLETTEDIAPSVAVKVASLNKTMRSLLAASS